MTVVMPAGVAVARDLVGPATEAAISRLSPGVRRVAAYHYGLADAEGNPVPDVALALLLGVGGTLLGIPVGVYGGRLLAGTMAQILQIDLPAAPTPRWPLASTVSLRR